VVLRKAVPACPQWSPDNRRLAVVAEGQDWSTPELRVVTLDGKERLLTLLPPYAYAFAWSPDGEAVAYLTEDAVWIAPLDGGGPELFWRSTPTPDGDPQGIPLPRAPTSLSWLSTGEIAVVVLSDDVSDGWPYVPEGPSVLHIIDVPSERHQKIELIDSDVATSAEVWSPDESRFAISDGDGAWILVYDRATGARVTLKPQLDDGSRLTINGVSWSADGERLLTDAQRGPDSQGGPFAWVSIDPDGASVEVLTPWTKVSYQPR
jgi:Tol biopolymer transport system component